jgi:hypothetical protein
MAKGGESLFALLSALKHMHAPGVTCVLLQGQRQLCSVRCAATTLQKESLTKRMYRLLEEQSANEGQGMCTTLNSSQRMACGNAFQPCVLTYIPVASA